MNTKQNIERANPKIDPRVVESFRAIQDKLPPFALPKSGADYHLSPPFDTKVIMVARYQGRASHS